MTARLISMSNGTLAPRSMRSVTVVSLGPRTLPLASSTVRPASAAPSIASITSPGNRPALSAGDPVSGRTTASRHSSLRVAHDAVTPVRSTVPIVAPIPSNWPASPWSDALNSSEVMYCE